MLNRNHPPYRFGAAIPRGRQLSSLTRPATANPNPNLAIEDLGNGHPIVRISSSQHTSKMPTFFQWTNVRQSAVRCSCNLPFISANTNKQLANPTTFALTAALLHNAAISLANPLFRRVLATSLFQLPGGGQKASTSASTDVASVGYKLTMPPPFKGA